MDGQRRANSPSRWKKRLAILTETTKTAVRIPFSASSVGAEQGEGVGERREPDPGPEDAPRQVVDAGVDAPYRQEIAASSAAS